MESEEFKKGIEVFNKMIIYKFNDSFNSYMKEELKVNRDIFSQKIKNAINK